MVQSYNYSFNLNSIAQEDLLEIERTFDTLRSSFQGLSAPASVGGQFWFGGAASTEDRLRVRNYANSSWLGVMLGDQYQRMWVYRAAAQPTMDGWIVDATVSDTVTAIKGGEYGSTPGVVVGTWTGTPHVHSMGHNHIWTRNTIDRGGNTTYDANGVSANFSLGLGSPGQSITGISWRANERPPQGVVAFTITGGINNYHTNNSQSNTGDGGGGGSTWRPTAAVGELQYLNLAP